MINDEDIQSIENRLSGEARRVPAVPPGRPSASGLAAEYHRRTRRRRAFSAGVFAAVAALAVLGITLYWPAERRLDLGGDARPGKRSSTPSVDPAPPLSAEPLAIPVLIAGRTEAGEAVIVIGWYLPDQALPGEFSEDSNAEFGAAGNLLGAQGDFTDGGTI
jgi:hypothetical protein